MHWTVAAFLTAFVSWLLWAFAASYVVSTIQTYWPETWAKLGSPEPAKIWFSRAFSGFDAAVLSRRFRHMGIENRDVLLQLELVFVFRLLFFAGLVGAFFSLLYAP